MATQFYIGKRLSYDGRLCTVRYQGEVKGTKGEWLGVEWDDPRRGKHSGEHGGIRYFECKVGPLAKDRSNQHLTLRNMNLIQCRP